MRRKNYADLITCRGTEKGFSLLELLSVIVIISLLFTISVPQLSKTAKYFHFRNKSKQLKTLLVFTRNSSVLEQNTYKLVVNFKENALQIFKKKLDEDDVEFELRSDTIFGPKKLPSGMFFVKETEFADRTEVIFEPDGKITAAKIKIVESTNTYTALLSTTTSGQIILEFL